MIDRLIIDENIEAIRNSISEIIKFKDPLGRIVEKWKRPNKLLIKKLLFLLVILNYIWK